MENHRLRIPAECTELVQELRACTYDGHTGDAVMATAIAVASIEFAGVCGRPASTNKGKVHRPILLDSYASAMARQRGMQRIITQAFGPP